MVGDTASVVQTLVDDYEVTGTSTIRVLALVERDPTLPRYATDARTTEVVAEVLAPRLAAGSAADRDRTVSLLTTALDVRTWDQLRHEAGRSVAETQQDLCRLSRPYSATFSWSSRTLPQSHLVTLPNNFSSPSRSTRGSSCRKPLVLG